MIFDFSKCKNYQNLLENIFQNVSVLRDVDFSAKYSGKSCPEPEIQTGMFGLIQNCSVFIRPGVKDNENISFLNGIRTHCLPDTGLQ